MQRTARSDVEVCAETGLVFLRIYYQKLPESVARRLTELSPVPAQRLSQGVDFAPLLDGAGVAALVGTLGAGAAADPGPHIVVEEKISKDALKKYGEDTVNAVGATWKQSDVFGYEVNIAKLEQIKAGG